MNLKDLKDTFQEELGNIYPKEESQTILNYILIDALGIPKLSIISQPLQELNGKQAEKVYSFLAELKKGVPIQHLLGAGQFYGMILKITPNVLIPRPETEELVDWIIKDNKGKKLEILDVGTGSGCIAIALKKNLPESDVTGVDILEKALEVAKKNAQDQNLDIAFKKANALDLEKELTGHSYAVIVSNPPYIPSSDRDKVQRNVYMYEPHSALFVPDEAPLLFYESIARFALKSKPVTLYFEINEEKGEELAKVLSAMGYKDIIIKKDLNGKNRMMKCRHF